MIESQKNNYISGAYNSRGIDVEMTNPIPYSGT